MSNSYNWNKSLNPSWLNDVLDFRRIVENLSKQTVYTDNSDMRFFLRFEKCFKIYKDISKFDTTLDISDLTLEFVESIEVPDVMQYMKFLDNCGNCRKTQANKLISMKILYKYLSNKVHLIKKYKFQELEIPKFEDRTIVSLPINECKKLVDIIVEKQLEMWERDLCIIVVFLNTGMRLSELANATLDKLDMENRKITVMGKR